MGAITKWKYFDKNKEKIALRKNKYAEKNKERIALYRKKYFQKKIKSANNIIL